MTPCVQKKNAAAVVCLDALPLIAVDSASQQQYALSLVVLLLVALLCAFVRLRPHRPRWLNSLQVVCDGACVPQTLCPKEVHEGGRPLHPLVDPLRINRHGNTLIRRQEVDGDAAVGGSVQVGSWLDPCKLIYPQFPQHLAGIRHKHLQFQEKQVNIEFPGLADFHIFPGFRGQTAGGHKEI